MSPVPNTYVSNKLGTEKRINQIKPFRKEQTKSLNKTFLTPYQDSINQ